jgi:flavin-dependent dehydrogenase
LSVSRFVLDPALVAIAREQGAEVREGFRVRDLYQHDGRVQGVVGPSGERLVADLVVGADGLHSVVARAIGASRTALWPRRLGLVAHFEGVDWPEEHGRMLVGRGTYIGIAPLDEHGLVTVGLVRALPCGHLGSPESAFEAVLSEYPAIAERVRRGRRTGTVVGIGPLARRVRTCAGPGFALVGDAAGFFDPFTGEGIFRALRSAELLADCPRTYARERRRRFAAKERLVALVQVLVQTPALMDLTVRRLQHRPNVARALGLVLGDLQPARLTLVWRLLAP